MARFTKDEMLDELRAIFLFTADLLMLGAGCDTAEQFMGFGCDRYEGYCRLPSSMVDLSRFSVTRTLEQAYEYAFRPSVLNIMSEEDMMDLMSFMLAVPKSGGVGCREEQHAYMTPEGLCKTTVDLAWARYALGGTSEDSCTEFTTRQLALLANMSEGAVRNALADKSENGLKAIQGSKPVAVTLKEARRWLKGRRGFVPEPDRPIDDPVVTERLAAARTVTEFGSLIRECSFLVKGNDYEALREPIGAWIDGTFIFDAGVAQTLATKLDLDVPLFVGKALEVSLRRDTHREGGAA